MQTVSGFGFNWNEEMDFDKCGGGNKRGGWKTKMDFDKRGGGLFLVEGLFFGGLFGCRAVFRYFPHQLRFGHSLGGFTVNRAFFTIFRQAEGRGRRAVFTRGPFFGILSTLLLCGPALEDSIPRWCFKTFKHESSL